ncbi:MAG: acylphosphatase [Clostridium sp.]|nr:acylphosphatase [Clostridium sp.]
MEKVRKHIRFGGRVQGVGFRYTACCLARSLGLTGWVKNLWDGDVEMEVQGSPEAVGKLIEGLNRGRFIRIESMDTEDIPIIKEGSFREIY